MTSLDEQWAALAALAEPLRRRLYLHVVSSAGLVSRDDAAAAMGVPRSVAAFHLDKLVGAGLLEVEYRRPPGRAGPGAGRPAKHYRRARREFAVSVPERHYDVVASLLAEAAREVQAPGQPLKEALHAAARRHGQGLGAAAAFGGGSGRPILDQLAEVLAGEGYEPRRESGALTLVNCPFQALAAAYPDLVCGMNHELVAGLIERLDAPGVVAVLDPGPDRCCVRVLVDGGHSAH